MNSLFQDYFEIILLIYGFAFFALSIVIYVLPKDSNQSPLLSNLSLIAVFAVLHGSDEFIEWMIFRYHITDISLTKLNTALSLVSYIPLVEFGRRLFYIQKNLVYWSCPLVYSALACAALSVIMYDQAASNIVAVVGHLFIGFPGATLAGFALLNYANKEKSPDLQYYLCTTGGGFIVYGLTKLVLPNSDTFFAHYFPSYNDFFAFLHIPVRVIRIVSVLMITISLTYLVRRINFYSRQNELAAIDKLNQFNEVLEQRVKKRTARLRQFIKLLRLDIAERKKLEKEREQFFAFFNFARDLQCIAGSDGYFKQVNPAFSETLGYSTQELLAKPFIEFIVPEDRQKTLAEVAKQLDSKVAETSSNGYCYVTLDFENRYLCADGSYRCLSWKAVFSPTEQLTYAVARDITEFKKNQRKLLLADMVYQNSIEAILVTDANNQIVAANPAFTEITGYALEDVMGKNPKIFKSGQYSDEFYRSMWQEINQKGHWQGEIWDKRKNGDLHAKFLNINTVYNQEGQIYRYLALFSDVTARKQYEEEIKRLSDSELNKAKLEAEKANQAKSDFLASMSHELRTPMNAVFGFAQLLECDELTEEQSESVKHILDASRHLMRLVNQVLDLSKIEADHLDINLEQVELSTLLQESLDLLDALMLKNGIKVHISNGCECHVMADPLRLKQVFINLISNAIKYNRPDGSITLVCETVNPKTVRVSVIDTGRGLSDAEIGLLFQPFERLGAKNSSIGGTGIGLCISKKLMAAMHGSIGVSSKVGEGSCFWIEVPLIAANI